MDIFICLSFTQVSSHILREQSENIQLIWISWFSRRNSKQQITESIFNSPLSPRISTVYILFLIYFYPLIIIYLFPFNFKLKWPLLPLEGGIRLFPCLRLYQTHTLDLWNPVGCFQFSVCESSFNHLRLPLLFSQAWCCWAFEKIM